jgi:crossover junction endodeoxyribonuclease RusA
MARVSKLTDRSDDPQPPLFEFCVHGRPRSGRSRNRAELVAWRRLVAAAANVAWPAGQLPVSVSVLLRITHYAQRQRADMDNIIKPIQDALEGIAYTNDRLVTDVTANWRNIDDRYRVRYMPEKLGAAFGKGSEFVYIRLWLAPDEKDLG